MKKIFTLFAGLLMAVAAMAADRRPVVLLENRSMRNYKVVIDGKSYFGDHARVVLDNFNNGYGNGYNNDNGNGYGFGSYQTAKRVHTIKVYEISRGFFARERLVDATTFMVGRNDITIRIDYSGQIRLREMRNNRGYSDWNDRDFRNDNDRDFRNNNDVRHWENVPDMNDHPFRDNQ